jgi:hypothetical protein
MYFTCNNVVIFLVYLAGGSNKSGRCVSNDGEIRSAVQSTVEVKRESSRRTKIQNRALREQPAVVV